METLCISEYRDGDISVLHSIDAICFPAGIAYSRAELLCYIQGPDSITRIARLHDSIVGFAIGMVEAPHLGHVLTLDVVPEMRRRRIGTSLITSLHEEFCRKGVEISVLEVDVDNISAQRFYGRLQYRYSEFLPGYYNGRSDAWRLLRNLNPDSNCRPQCG